MGTVLSCVPGHFAFVETEAECFRLERHDPLEKNEYVRFAIGRRSDDSHVEQGILQAAQQALERQNIAGSDVDVLHELRSWLSENLKKQLPSGVRSFALASVGLKRPPPHTSHPFGRVQILERNGIYVRKIRTDKPGYVIHEDHTIFGGPEHDRGQLVRLLVN